MLGVIRFDTFQFFLNKRAVPRYIVAAPFPPGATLVTSRGLLIFSFFSFNILKNLEYKRRSNLHLELPNKMLVNSILPQGGGGALKEGTFLTTELLRNNV